jgi:putative peptidoglycan lipid II flippase
LRLFERIRRRHSVVIFGGMCLSMAIGVVMQSFLANEVGTARAADVYYLGSTVPTLIAIAVLGSAANALVRYAVSDESVLDLRVRESVARRLVPYACAVSLGVATAGAMLAVAGGEHRALGIFVLLTTPVPVLVLAAASGAVVAMSRDDFIRGTYGNAVNGMGLLVAAVALSRGGLTAWKLALALDVGYACQLAFVAPALIRIRSVKGPVDAAVATAARQSFVVLAAASIVYKAQPLVERSVGAALGNGVPAALGYADKIASGLGQLAIFGFALASLPAMARHLNERDFEAASSRLVDALSATAASTIAVLAFGWTSANQLVRLFYERGAFGPHAATMTSTLVACSLPTIAFGAAAGPLVSLHYAAGRARWVTKVGIAGFATGTAATIVLASLIGYPGIVIGTGVGATTTFAVFVHRVPDVLPDWSWRRWVHAVGPRLMSVAIATVTAALLVALLAPRDGRFVVALLVVIARLTVVLGVALAGIAWLRRDRNRLPVPAVGG